MLINLTLIVAVYCIVRLLTDTRVDGRLLLALPAAVLIAWLAVEVVASGEQAARQQAEVQRRLDALRSF